MRYEPDKADLLEGTSMQGSLLNNAAQSKTRKKPSQAHEDEKIIRDTAPKRRGRSRTNPVSPRTPGPPPMHQAAISDFTFINGSGTMINENIGNTYNLTRWWLVFFTESKSRFLNSLHRYRIPFSNTRHSIHLSDSSILCFKLPGHQNPFVRDSASGRIACTWLSILAYRRSLWLKSCFLCKLPQLHPALLQVLEFGGSIYSTSTFKLFSI